MRVLTATHALRKARWCVDRDLLYFVLPTIEQVDDTITLSILEIYNENINDLLSEATAGGNRKLEASHLKNASSVFFFFPFIFRRVRNELSAAYL